MLVRGPREREGDWACQSFFDKLTPEAVQMLQKVRFFTQMFWLERGDELNALMAMPNFRPTELTITIRYSDWWDWEDNAPLHMGTAWLTKFKGNPGLRKLRVEYETLSWKKDEMMQIIERNKQWGSLKVMGNSGEPDDIERYLDTRYTALNEWKWVGKSKLDGQRWDHHGPGETVEYGVVTDTWVFVEDYIGRGIETQSLWEES